MHAKIFMHRLAGTMADLNTSCPRYSRGSSATRQLMANRMFMSKEICLDVGYHLCVVVLFALARLAGSLT